MAYIYSCLAELCVCCCLKNEEVITVSPITSLNIISTDTDNYPVRVKSRPVKLPEEDEELKNVVPPKPPPPIQPSVYQHSVPPVTQNVHELIQASK